jgi:hypothetical protein
VVVVVALSAALASTAVAQVPTGDSVTGTVTEIAPPPIGTARLNINASSGPSGETPTGTIAAELLDFGVLLDFQVTCLAVNGNAATVGARHVDPALGEQLLYLQIVAGGPGRADQLGTVATGSTFACARPPLPFVTTQTITSGDLVVVDSQARPSSKDQCKNGGWRNFGAFKNQGDCVSFVLRKRAS